MLLAEERVASAAAYSVEAGEPDPASCKRLLLATLGRSNLAFSEANQAIYQLNDLAFYVWRSVEAGMSAGAIVRELVAAGVSPDRAECDVGLAWTEYLTRNSAAGPSPSRSQPERLTSLSLSIANVVVHLHLSDALAGNVEQVFGPLMTDLPSADIVLCARVTGSTVNVFSPGQEEWSCSRCQFIPLLKAKLIEWVVQYSRYEVALHAAAIARETGAMLLMGGPGAGKSTLAIALHQTGLEVLSDDVVLLATDGRIFGIPLPFTAKSSSWGMLSERWPGIVDYPSHSRPDGQAVRYIPLGRAPEQRSEGIGTVVILNRQDGARAGAEELDLDCALVALIEEGATWDDRLSSSGFCALVEGLRGARCCRLTYSDLGEAAEALSRFDR